MLRDSSYFTADCRAWGRRSVFLVICLLLVGPLAADAQGNSRAGPCPNYEPGPTTIPKPDVIYDPSPNFHDRSVVLFVDSIVMHTTEGSLEDVLELFRDDFSSTQVSAHYVIAPNGDIYEMVSPSDHAKHATYYNNRSIGIEMVGRAASPSTWNDDNLDALVDLLAWLHQAYPNIPPVHPDGDAYDFPGDRYNEPGLVAHSQVQPWNKSDPGVYFPWNDVLGRVSARLERIS